MTIYNTTDSNIIFIHNDYKKIKQITQRMKDLKMRLLNEKIIKESQNYIVFTNDKFSYTSYIKFKKAFIRDYISDDYEAYNNIDKKYYKYWLDDNELIHSNNQKYSLLVDYMATFNFYEMFKLKNKLKKLLKCKLLNKNIRQVGKFLKPLLFETCSICLEEDNEVFQGHFKCIHGICKSCFDGMHRKICPLCRSEEQV
jgi:hypothetical protein